MLTIDLTGRTAIVCGGSKGIGRGIASALHEAGANLSLFARASPELSATTTALGALAVEGDLTRLEDRRRLVDATVERFGGVDILIHNGGGPSDARASDLTSARLDDAIDLVLRPVVELTRACLPQLERSGRGRIVIIGSPTFRESQDGRALSNILRPAVVGWAKTLSREVGPAGITVNTIAPGRVETGTFEEYYATRSRAEDLAQIPLGRFGDPREVGDAVAFLSSELAAYVSGCVIPVDGGLSRSW